MTATPETFRATFPAFHDEAVFPVPLIRFYLELAQLMLPAQRWGTLLDYGSQLFAAHHLALEERAQQESALGGVPGSATGVVSSKSAGPVSLSMDTNVAAEQGVGFWNLTTYGLRFYRLVRMVGMGGLQLGIPGGVQPCVIPISAQCRAELITFVGVPVFKTEQPSSIPPAPKIKDDGFVVNPALLGGM